MLAVFDVMSNARGAPPRRVARPALWERRRLHSNEAWPTEARRGRRHDGCSHLRILEDADTMKAPAKQLDELYDLIGKIKTAMLTTRRPDDRLVSRPMATQQREPIADL